MFSVSFALEGDLLFAMVFNTDDIILDPELICNLNLKRKLCRNCF